MDRSAQARRLAVAIALLAALVWIGVVPASGSPRAVGSAERGERFGPPTSTEVRAATREFRRTEPTAEPGAPLAPWASRRARLLEDSRVVSFYGAPQLTRTIIGRLSVERAARRLKRQAAEYVGPRRPAVVPSFDIISTIATADAGPDGLYRMRQSPAVLDAYQERITRLGGRLVLDIQPGRADLLDEIRAQRSRILAENVDVAIDPEWNVGPQGVPGSTEGSVTARRINLATEMLQRWSDKHGLGPKLLLVHQFREGSIRRRGRIRRRPGVEVVLNFDGIGSPDQKRAGYVALGEPGLASGFSLFLSLDSDLMTPRQVMRLDPEALNVMYQ